MERYIGMDVHAASCTLAVISEKGRRLRDFPVETNGQALVEAGTRHLGLSIISANDLCCQGLTHQNGRSVSLFAPQY